MKQHGNCHENEEKLAQFHKDKMIERGNVVQKNKLCIHYLHNEELALASFLTEGIYCEKEEHQMAHRFKLVSSQLVSRTCSITDNS